MAVTTEHKFIDTYLIKRESKYLIIGTIHPHRTDDFEVNFFYGNKNTLWSILSEAFPNRDFSSAKKIIETLNNSLTSIMESIPIPYLHTYPTLKERIWEIIGMKIL